MQIKKFYATTVPAAIRDVRRTLGPEAVILSTRHLSTEDARVIVNGAQARVEVTAAREAPEPRMNRGAEPKGGQGKAPEERPESDAGARRFAERLQHLREKGLSGKLPRMADRAAGAAAAGDSEALKTIIAEIRSLKQRLDTIDPGAANPSARPNPYLAAMEASPPARLWAARKEAPKVPPEPLADIAVPGGETARALLGWSCRLLEPEAALPACEVQRRLREQGVDEALVQRILERMHFVAGREAGEQPERGSFGHFIQVVRDFLPEAPERQGKPLDFSRHSAAEGPRRVAVVGPTGVGKTTTIAKIASHCALRENLKVGLVTLDTYRVAAAEQLKTYARLLGVPVVVVGEPARLGEAFEKFATMDVVLVDTPGHSPRDDEAMGRLADMLSRDNGLEVHLMLPASTRLAEMRHIMESFRPMRYEGLIFSKLDEATAWGDLLSAWIMGGFEVSYFTTGQRVPEDLQVASVETLCQCLMAREPARGGQG